MDAKTIDYFADNAGIGDKNTISSGPDEGANNKMAACFWKAKRHNSTVNAVSNGLSPSLFEQSEGIPESYTSTGALNIGGHGNSGVLETGMGQSGPFDINQWVATWTESVWGPQLDRIKPSSITLVSIWSCHTGADADGAELLYAMAKRCGRAVRGRTGFTYTNGKTIWFEKGSVWQVATPSHKPAPIPAPTSHFNGMEDMLLGENLVNEDNIEQVEFNILNVAGNSTQAIVLNDKVASAVIMSLINKTPMQLSDISISGFVTANIRITLKGKGNKKFDFIVYNDKLVVETSEKVGFYLTASLAQLLNTVSS